MVSGTKQARNCRSSPDNLLPRFPVITLFLLLLSGFKIRVRTFIYAAVPAAAQIQSTDPAPLASGGQRECAVPAASSALRPTVRVVTADQLSEGRDNVDWQ